MRGIRSIGPALVVAGLLAAPSLPAEVPVSSRWFFDADHVSGDVAFDLAGSFDATIHGAVRLAGDPPAIVLDGARNDLTMGEGVHPLLPRREISVEAWVRLDAGAPRGGIIGYVQDDGDGGHGWLLGYDETHFSFAISDGAGLTYLTGTTAFEPGAWYHVAGTYDGAAMTLYVNGSAEASSTDRSGDIDYAPSTYAMGAYHDDDEHVPMRGRLHEIRVYDGALTPADILDRYEAKRSLREREAPPPAPEAAVSLGPYVEFTGAQAATVHWHTPVASASILEYGEADVLENRVEDPVPKTAHAIPITGLERDTKYVYRIRRMADASEVASETYTLETNFDFRLPDIPDRPSPYEPGPEAEVYRRAAERILSATGIARGYGLVLGAGRGRLMYELAKRSELMLVGVATDASEVDGARRALARAGLYGPRANVRRVASLERLPFRGRFANLIVSDRMITEGECIGSAAEMFRLLRPGGVAYLGRPAGSAAPLSAADLSAWLDAAGLTYTISDDAGGLWAEVVPERPAGAGDWTHQYGGADNAACSHDALEGATGRGELVVQWIGRPGGDAVMDRNPRKPAPLSAGGRVFLQGFRRIIAMDAYNGAILWSLEIPHLGRTNIPRDAGNWCADDDSIYAAIRDRCWRIDAATGEVAAAYDVSLDPAEGAYDWGYVASAGGRIFGSATRRGASYTDFLGHASWFDQTSGYGTWKVCSDSIFALGKEDGRREWTYAQGVIIDSTITVGGNRVYFVECRNRAVREAESRRIGLSALWHDQYLVALDAASGGLLWQRPIDVADGIMVFYLGYTDDPAETLILTSSGRRYDLYAFDAANGEERWHGGHAWPSDNHGGHMQHPVLLAGRAFLWPYVYRIADGARISPGMPPRSGCPTFAAGSQVFVYRGAGGVISLWDSVSGRVSRWESIRPGCWLSMIPAAGMILAPEGGAGCSCGGWLQTSIAFSPGEGE